MGCCASTPEVVLHEDKTPCCSVSNSATFCEQQPLPPGLVDEKVTHIEDFSDGLKVAVGKSVSRPQNSTSINIPVTSFI
jgi:hypothetical protein